MSEAVTLRPERSRRVGGVALLVTATLLAGVAGALLGSALAPDPSEPPAAAEPDPRIGLRSGVARLALPAGWEPLGRRSALPGFEQATAVRAGRGEVALDLRAPEHPSLLPSEIAAAGELPEPRPREVGSRSVWRYDLGDGVVALVLPTTGGVLTVGCGRSAQTGAECEQAMRTVWLEGASALPPAPATAAAIALPGIVAQLNQVRRDERRRLAATPWPLQRARAARQLAGAYRAAAADLRPLAAGEAEAVVTTLAELALAHEALAAANRRRAARRAGGRRAARAARRASATIADGERRLGAQLTAVPAR